jgi:uridine kinase
MKLSKTTSTAVVIIVNYTQEKHRRNMASLTSATPTTTKEEQKKTGNSKSASPTKGLFDKPVLVVAIAGGTGSGKTSVANAIRKKLGDEHIAFISHDSYYKDLSHLTLEKRAANNFDHPNSLDTELMVEDLKKLRNGQATNIPMYDFSTHSRISTVELVEPKPVLLVEGILIFSEPELRNQFDIKIFVDAPADIRLIRRLERDRKERGRDGHSVIKQYLSTVRPMHIEFVEPSKRHADIIIPEGGHNKIALDMVISRLQRDLASRGAIVEGEWSPFRRPVEPPSTSPALKDNFKL